VVFAVFKHGPIIIEYPTVDDGIFVKNGDITPPTVTALFPPHVPPDGFTVNVIKEALLQNSETGVI